MYLTDQWIVGFVDGDGCFKKVGSRFCFVVSQDQRSVHVLYALKQHFGCGSVNKAGQNMREYRVSKKEHLIRFILPFFIKNPLQSNKRFDFLLFYEDLMQLSLSSDLFEKPGISREWLMGFIDAEANFYFSMVKNYPRPQFVIGLHQQDLSVLQNIRTFLNCGLIYEKRPKQGNVYFVYQISCLKGFQILIQACTTSTNRCLLKTTKRIFFLRFKKVVNLIAEKKHLTEKGSHMIEKIYKSLR
jgi:hypothetical protein